VAEAAEDLLTPPKKRPAAKKPTKHYPERAKWLRKKLRECGRSLRDLEADGGPSHETTGRILAGLAVQSRVLQKLAKTLGVQIIEIPRR
jgi:hypothetical protein